MHTRQTPKNLYRFAPPLIRFGVGDDGDPPEGDPPEEPQQTVEQWLETQPQDVKDQFAALRADVKKPLRDERSARQTAENDLKAAQAKIVKLEAQVSASSAGESEAVNQAQTALEQEQKAHQATKQELTDERLKIKFLRQVKASGYKFESQKAEDLAWDALNKELAGQSDTALADEVEVVAKELGVLFTPLEDEREPNHSTDGRSKGGARGASTAEIKNKKAQSGAYNSI